MKAIFCPSLPLPMLVRGAAVGVCLLTCGAAHAAIIASDNFLTGGPTENYVVGNLNGQVKTAGTIGYYTGATAAPQTSGWASNTGAFAASVGGVTHPLTANPAGANDGKVVATGNANTRVQYRDFTSTTPPASTDYYFSALMRKTATTLPGTTFVGLSTARVAGLNNNPPTGGFFVGFSGSSLSLFYNDGAAIVSKSLVTSATLNIAYMATLHYSTTTGLLTPMIYDDTGALVNNPVLDAVAATVNATDMGAFYFSISSEFLNASSGTMAYDELRFGTELTDVMIPEPASVALLMGGLGVLGLVRRRG